MTINLKELLFKTIHASIIISIVFNMYGIYTSGEIIKKTANVFMLFVVLCCSIYILIFRKGIRFGKENKLNIYLIVLLIYESIIIIVTGTFYSYNTIIDVLAWPLICIVYSTYSSMATSDKKNSRWIIIYLLIMAFSSMLAYRHFKGLDDIGISAFYAYYCISFLPFILRTKPTKRGNALLFLPPMIIILITLKRAGLIAIILSFLCYLLVDSYIEGILRKKIRKILKVITLSIFLMILLNMSLKVFDIDIIKRLSNIFNDGGSGRTEIWEIVITNFRQSSILEKFFGHGYQSVSYKLMPRGNYSLAHNSYIEYLYDYGYIGFFMLIAIVFLIVKKNIKLLKLKKQDALYMSMSVAIMFILSSFSYFFEVSSIIIPVSMLWAISNEDDGMFIGKENLKND